MAKILVVDDEPSIVDSVATVLRYEGFRSRRRKFGPTRSAKGPGAGFDLIVLDVMLPDLDGLEVTRRIRSPTGSTFRSSSSRPRATSTIGWPACPSAETTTSPSRSRWWRSWRDQRRSCVAASPGDDAGFAFRRPRHGRGEPRGLAGRDPVHLTPTEFNLLRLFLVEPPSRPLQGPDHRPRLALRLRRQPEHRRDLRPLSAQEARRPRPAVDPHHPARRLRAPRRGVRERSAVASNPPPCWPSGPSRSSRWWLPTSRSTPRSSPTSTARSTRRSRPRTSQFKTRLPVLPGDIRLDRHPVMRPASRPFV
jgi:CheY-like chemotaxis protein